MTENQGKAAPRTWSQQLPKGFEGKPEEFSMNMTILVRTLRDGVANNRSWLGLTGLDQNGRFLKAATYGPFADTVKRQIESKMSPGADLEDEGIILELKGSFYQREAAGDVRADRQFRFSGFEFLTGPSNELFRERQRAGAAADDAKKALERGDIRGAYKAFEKFACSFASTSEPSLDFGELFETDMEAFVEMTDAESVDTPTEVVSDDAPQADRSFGVPEADAGVVEATDSAEPAQEEHALAEMNGTRGFEAPPVAQVVRPAGMGLGRGRFGRPVSTPRPGPEASAQPEQPKLGDDDDQAPVEEIAEAAPVPARAVGGLGRRRL